MSIINNGNHNRSSIYLPGILSLLFVLLLAQPGMAAKKQGAKSKSVEYKLTVGGVSPSRDDQNYMEVIFLESTRYYKISKKSRKYIALLNEAQKSQKPVMVKRANEYSDIIIRVRKAEN